MFLFSILSAVSFVLLVQASKTCIKEEDQVASGLGE